MNKLLIILFFAAVLASQANAELIVAYNETAGNATGHYWPYSIGWLWKATADFSLTRIETKFGDGYERITIAVYDGLPQLGGTLLGSADYNAVGGLWDGADLGPIDIEEGQDYLVSFWNVDGMGMNYTQDSGAEQFSMDNYIYYDEDGELPASFVSSFTGSNNCCTIIRIYGNTIPEPATIALLGFSSLVLLRKHKYHKQRQERRTKVKRSVMTTCLIMLTLANLSNIASAAVANGGFESGNVIPIWTSESAQYGDNWDYIYVVDNEPCWEEKGWSRINVRSDQQSWSSAASAQLCFSDFQSGLRPYSPGHEQEVLLILNDETINAAPATIDNNEPGYAGFIDVGIYADSLGRCRSL